MAFIQGHALVIGVGTHRREPRLDVPITVEDAKAVAAVIADPSIGAYPAAQVTVIHDADATKDGILAGLDELAARAGENATVFVFYCGHGALGDDGNYYLLGHDVKLNGSRVAAGTGVSEAELLEKLRRFKAKRMLMVFNACHSGNLSPALAPDAGSPTLPTSNPDGDTLTRVLGTGEGRITITACREGQLSYIGRGSLTIFTQALVDALRGKGVTNRKGYISAFDLYETIYDSVGEAVAEIPNAAQEPELTVLKGVGPFAVALYKGASALGAFDETGEPPSVGSVRQVRPEKSRAMLNSYQEQSGGVNFGAGNVFQGPVAGANQENYTLGESQGAVIKSQGPVTQTFGSRSGKN
jgi:uncharacterized caspase-like protein